MVCTMPVDCTGMIASRCGPHLTLLPAWRPLVPLSSSSSSSPPRRAATMREPSPPPAPPLPMRAPAPRCQRRRRAETLHCIHESRCGPHLALLPASSWRPLSSSSSRPRPRPPHCRICDRRIPPLPRASRSKLVNDSRGK